MGQFLDYLASVFTGKVEAPSKEKSSSHVTFAENSFTQAFGGKSESEKAAKLASLSQKNRNTIYLYHIIGLVSFLAHFTFVTVPKVRLDSFDFLEPQNWQLITLSLIPLLVYVASFGAMIEVNKPISEATKLTSKNSNLNLNDNDFIFSLKVIVLLTAICQVLSIFSNDILWFVVVIVSIWCYQLTSKLAHSEHQRYAPTPKKQWVKLNLSRSPKTLTPAKPSQPAVKQVANNNGQVPATPRTRTRRAVKQMLDGVSDKYHAFEQNVAHQISQKIFNPASPKLKAIE